MASYFIYLCILGKLFREWMTEKLSSKKRDIYMTHSFEELGSHLTS